jgi:hypothetical protein
VNCLKSLVIGKFPPEGLRSGQVTGNPVSRDVESDGTDYCLGESDGTSKFEVAHDVIGRSGKRRVAIWSISPHVLDGS